MFFISPEFLGLSLSLLSILFFLPYQWSNDNTVEDLYQKDRKTKYKDDGALIHVKMDYRVPSDKFRSLLSKLENRLLQYNYNYNSVQNKYRINPYFNYIFKSNDLFQACNWYHYKFLIDEPRQVIHAKIKHEYIGGAYLLELFYCFLNEPQKASDKLFPKSQWYHILLLPKLLWFLAYQIPVITNPLPLFKQDEQIERFSTSYTLTKQTSTKSFILYRILSILHNSLQLDRDLICYLPIAFQSKPGIKNNIGLIWLKFNPNTMTETQFDKELEQSKWQALATNACLHLLPSSMRNIGKDVRKNVDVVVSFMLGTDDFYFDASWTFEHISDYPIYVAIASIKQSNGDVVVTNTVTSSTPSLTYSNIAFNDLVFTKLNKSEFIL